MPEIFGKMFATYIYDKEFTSTMYRNSHKLKRQTNLIFKWAKELNRTSKKNIQMANKDMKRRLVSLVVRDMEIKATMRYYMHQNC